MYKLIQKNQKKLLAVFMTLLMIVFILPTATKNNLSQGDIAIGKVGTEAVYGREINEGKDDLRLLEQHRFPPLFALGEGAALPQFSQHEDLYVVLQKEAIQQGISISTQQADRTARDSIDLTDADTDVIEQQIVPAVGRFLLVQAAYERAAASAKMSSPLLKYLIANNLQQLGFNLVEFKAEEFLSAVPPPTPEQIRQRYEVYGDVLPSKQTFLSLDPPTIGYKLPDRVKLQYLELPHDAVVQSVLNELTPDDLYRLDEEAYRYYADPRNSHEFAVAPPLPTTLPSTGPMTAPSTGATSNPLAGASTQAATQGLASSQPATGPTTKPFAVVRDELRKKLVAESKTPSTSDVVVSIRDRIAARSKQVRTALRNGLDTAYTDWANGPAAPTSGPALTTTAPTTQAVQGYADLDFLDRFAGQFESQYHVRPLAHSMNKDWLTREDLAILPEIGNAKAGSLPFPNYLLRDLAPPLPPVVPASGPASLPTTVSVTTASTARATASLAAAIAPTTAPLAAAPTPPTTSPSYAAWRPIGMGLHPFEPTEVLVDSDDNAYVARLTGYDPEHRPPLEEVMPRIVKDLTTAAAMQRAHEEAAKLLNSAAVQAKLVDKDNSPVYRGGLPAAAGAAGRTLLRPGPFSANLAQADFNGFSAFRYLQARTPGYEVRDSTDKIAFLKAIQFLMKQATPADRHPTSLTDLITEQKVLVMELSNVMVPWTPSQQFPVELELADLGQLNLQAGSVGLAEIEQLVQKGGPTPTSLAAEWFDYDNALARSKYVKTEKKS